MLHAVVKTSLNPFSHTYAGYSGRNPADPRPVGGDIAASGHVRMVGILSTTRNTRRMEPNKPRAGVQSNASAGSSC